VKIYFIDCVLSLSLFRSIEMTIYRRGWSIATIFQTTQAKKSVIPIDKATINAFLKNIPI
jgi:hypothetical protein